MQLASDILDHHLKCFGDRDLEGILADYSTEAIIFSPDATYHGPQGIRPIFQKQFDEFAKPGASINLQRKVIVDDYAYIVWNAETADSLYELANDTFLIRDGKILLHSFAAKITPRV